MYTKLVLLLLGCTQLWAVPKRQLSEKEMHPTFPSTRITSRMNSEELSKNYWHEKAQSTLKEKLRSDLNHNVAKNVILFLGDGMSIPTLAATRVYMGGEEAQLSFEKFPYTALSKTYAVDRQTPDSANTATAYLCGVKANYGTIGVGPEVTRGDCDGQAEVSNHAHSIAYHSQLRRKKTGLVTTARVTHASPGGVYAHTANRDWESDTDILKANQDPWVCPDIATQLVYGETGRNLNVVLGGGRSKFLPRGVDDGERSDGANLIEEWMDRKRNAAYVWNRDQLLNISHRVDNLLGLFSADHVDYNLDRDPNVVPSLSEMTEAAINVLSKSRNGYFLFVEAARIDMGHHAAEARVALDEAAELSKAVQRAVELTDEEDTLIVVTSDHAHTMSLGGYAARGNDIFGFAGTGSDNIVYNTLNYANGPGYKPPNSDGSRFDVSTDSDSSDPHYTFPAVAPLAAETHGGDDVAIFARGPWSHLFTGVLEENVIPHIMSFASCVGKGITICDN